MSPQTQDRYCCYVSDSVPCEVRYRSDETTSHKIDIVSYRFSLSPLLLLSSSLLLSWSSYSYSDDLVSFSFSSRVVCNVSRESSMHCDEDVFEDLLRLVFVEGIFQKNLLDAGLVPVGMCV